jgi:glycosyltransferase involved in cell wall biosynthesis
MNHNTYDFCFVSLKCYDLLAGLDKPKYLGGIEKVTVSLARGLAKAGYKVAFITYDQGQDDVFSVDGVDVYKTYDPESVGSKFSAIHPKMTSIWHAMNKAKAKIYVQMGAGTETGISAYFTKIKSLVGSKSKFVFLVASNSDCDTGLPLVSHKKEKMIYKVGLKVTDLVISQTNVQKEMLKKSFGYNSEVLQSPIETPAVTKDDKEKGDSSKTVLWMGRIIKEKRLEMLLDVAKSCPDITFNVVGTPNQEDEYYKSVIKRAKEISNVRILGKISESKLPEAFSEADIFCSTSMLEGFPTTFLEAWSHAVPVVTTFDPDGIVDREGLGLVVSSSEQMIEAIQMLMSSPIKLEEISNRAKSFFDKHYSIDAVVPKFITILQEKSLFGRDG